MDSAECRWWFYHLTIKHYVDPMCILYYSVWVLFFLIQRVINLDKLCQCTVDGGGGGVKRG